MNPVVTVTGAWNAFATKIAAFLPDLIAAIFIVVCDGSDDSAGRLTQRDSFAAIRERVVKVAGHGDARIARRKRTWIGTGCKNKNRAGLEGRSGRERKSNPFETAPTQIHGYTAGILKFEKLISGTAGRVVHDLGKSHG